jgi:hypothetical protein
MISKSGAGPAPLPGKTVTAKQFAAAFEDVHDSRMQEVAVNLSNNFRHEHGCEVAVRSFHAYLPLTKMRSDLEPSFSACFRLNEYALQISRPVAQVLVAAGAIEESDLSSHHVQNWYTFIPVNHCQGINRGFKRAVSKIADSMHRLKRSRSTSYMERKSPRRSKNDIKRELISVGHPFRDCLPLYGEIKEKSQEERDQDSKTEKQIKHTVHYGLATLTEKVPINNQRHTTVGTGPSPAIHSPRKNFSKPRTNNISHNLPDQNNHRQLSKKSSHSFLTNTKPLLLTKDKTNNKSPEQKAADMSGFSIAVCKKILSDFEQIKQDRKLANNNEQLLHRIKFPSLRRSRSRSSTDAQ